MQKFFLTLGIAVVALPAVLGLSIAAMLWRAWWLYPAWAWYIEPLGVPTINFWHFTALMMLVGTLTSQTDIHKDERPINWGACGAIYVWPIVAWLILRWLR